MRVIITGGTGFLGQALAADLAKDSHEVIMLSRFPQRFRGALPQSARLVMWDGKTAQGWGELAEGAGAIVNLAGDNLSNGRWTAAKKERILNSRINAGQAVTQAVEQAAQKPGVVIQASAVGYYGLTGDRTVVEDMPAGKDFLAAVCAAWEGATSAVENLGVRRVITRTGLPLSSLGGILPLFALPYRMFVGGPVGSGRQWIPWIHIDDWISAVRFLIDQPQASGPFNLSAPEPRTNREFGNILARVLKRPPFMPVPSLVIKLLFGEMSIIILEGQRELPRRLQESGFQFRFSDLEAALRNLYRK